MSDHLFSAIPDSILISSIGLEDNFCTRCHQWQFQCIQVTKFGDMAPVVQAGSWLAIVLYTVVYCLGGRGQEGVGSGYLDGKGSWRHGGATSHTSCTRCTQHQLKVLSDLLPSLNQGHTLWSIYSSNRRLEMCEVLLITCTSTGSTENLKIFSFQVAYFVSSKGSLSQNMHFRLQGPEVYNLSFNPDIAFVRR